MIEQEGRSGGAGEREGERGSWITTHHTGVLGVPGMKGRTTWEPERLTSLLGTQHLAMHHQLLLKANARASISLPKPAMPTVETQDAAGACMQQHPEEPDRGQHVPVLIEEEGTLLNGNIFGFCVHTQESASLVSLHVRTLTQQ